MRGIYIFLFFYSFLFACMPSPLIVSLDHNIKIKMSTSKLQAGLILEGRKLSPKILEILDSNKNKSNVLHALENHKSKWAKDKKLTLVSLVVRKNQVLKFPSTYFLKVLSDGNEYRVELTIYKEKPLRKGLRRKGGCGSYEINKI